MSLSKTSRYLWHGQNFRLGFGLKCSLTSPLVVVFLGCLLLFPYQEAGAVKPPESAEDYAALKGEIFTVIRV